MKKVILFFILLVPLGVMGQILSPQVFSAMGGHSVGNNAQVTFTAGEPFYQTVSNDNSILTQGFNQILIITKIEQLTEPNWNITVFPNPTFELINVNFNSDLPNNLTIQLLDLEGRTIDVRNTTQSLEQFNLSKLPPAMYFIRIKAGNDVVVYKIQKL